METLWQKQPGLSWVWRMKVGITKGSGLENVPESGEYMGRVMRPGIQSRCQGGGHPGDTGSSGEGTCLTDLGICWQCGVTKPRWGGGLQGPWETCGWRRTCRKGRWETRRPGHLKPRGEFPERVQWTGLKGGGRRAAGSDLGIWDLPRAVWRRVWGRGQTGLEGVEGQTGLEGVEGGETEAEHVVPPRDRPPSTGVETGSERGSNLPKASWVGRVGMEEGEVQMGQELICLTRLDEDSGVEARKWVSPASGR